MGDPAGSGPEIIIKALTKEDLLSKAKIMIIGDWRVFKKASEIVHCNELKLIKVEKPSDLKNDQKKAYILDLGNVDISNLVYGKPSVLGGKSAYECIVKAVDYAISNEVDAIVTAPISKESLNMAGYNYPGHTELLAELTGSKDYRMMLVARHLRVAHVTTHVSLKHALDLIKKENILNTIKIVNRSLMDLFGINQPKIAVSGLNPHAGEGGLFGDEEIKEIKPAIDDSLSQGINALGPYPPDTVFYRAYYNREFDAVIAMYHDQGHIAMKMVGFMEGINITLGLPIIRVSPDHGTVWGKAGKGTADEGAMLESIKLGIELASKRIKRQ
jgi:4-hydroxythreonine-4-phosphate dehydrogenase